MKISRLVALLILSGALGFSLQASADVNVAFEKPVTLDGIFFTGGWGGGQVVGADTITDGISFEDGHLWDQGGVWWNGWGWAGPDNKITVNLGSNYSISSFYVQADNNDNYLVEYKAGSSDWQLAWYVPTFGDHGLNSRSVTLDTPIIADTLRLSVENKGDHLYSISELRAFGILNTGNLAQTEVSAVPEAETSKMMLAGLCLIGFVAARRFN